VLPPSQATYAAVRQTASHYMFSHPDDFIPFLPVVREAGDGDIGLMTRDAFEQYCASVRDTALWGGEPEIMALSRAYNVPIHVVQGGRPPIVMFKPTDTDGENADDSRVLRISYHRRMYGLGEVRFKTAVVTPIPISLLALQLPASDGYAFSVLKENADSAF